MPKFKKTEHELITREDKWFYAINNLIKFTEIPLVLADDPIFKSFFMDAKTAHLTELELQAYYAERKAEWDRYAELETAVKEGELKGIESATIERNTTFAAFLLQNTTQTPEQIATAINVPISFVLDIYESLKQ